MARFRNRTEFLEVRFIILLIFFFRLFDNAVNPGLNFLIDAVFQLRVPRAADDGDFDIQVADVVLLLVFPEREHPGDIAEHGNIENRFRKDLACIERYHQHGAAGKGGTKGVPGPMAARRGQFGFAELDRGIDPAVQFLRDFHGLVFPLCFF